MKITTTYLSPIIKSRVKYVFGHLTFSKFWN